MKTKKQKDDRPIGAHPYMNEEQYRAVDAVNISSLKHISRSPAHYKAALDNPREATQAQVIGSMLHATVAEPQRTHYVVRPDGMSFASSTRAQVSSPGRTRCQSPRPSRADVRRKSARRQLIMRQLSP